MTDGRTEYGDRRASGFDDDRLLACALGLDDDPELLRAAETDADLGARLAAMRADVDVIGAQVRAAVPEPDESYVDLSGERWGGLREYFVLPASAAAPRGRRWWRVVAPVAALAVLALVAGIVAVDRGGQSASTGSSAEVARTATDTSGSFAGQSESTKSGEGETADPATTPGTAAPPPVEAAPPTAAQRLAEQLDRFAVVVLARAREATGALQRFAVLRIFKGDAPQMVELEVDDQPAAEGRLHLLLLDPTTAGDAKLQSPEPTPSLGTTGGDAAFGRALAVAYTYHGEPTLVREFAAGTDPDMVSLPIP
jgi:hypothetical protein